MFMIFSRMWRSRFFSLFFLLGIFVVMGAGCKNSSTTDEQKEETFTQEDLPTFDSETLTSSPSSSPDAEEEPTSSRGPLRGRVQEVIAGRSVLLLNEGCSPEEDRKSVV